MPALTLPELLAKRDAAHKRFIDAQAERFDAFHAYQVAQDEFAAAILATGTDTFIDDDGNEHVARRGGGGTVFTTKAKNDG